MDRIFGVTCNWIAMYLDRLGVRGLTRVGIECLVEVFTLTLTLSIKGEGTLSGLHTLVRDERGPATGRYGWFGAGGCW